MRSVALLYHHHGDVRLCRMSRIIEAHSGGGRGGGGDPPLFFASIERGGMRSPAGSNENFKNG